MKYRKIFICILLLNFSYFSQVNNFKSKFNIDTSYIKKHIEILGSDLFEGRGTGTKGGELAANYIAGEFQKNNLIPIGDNKTYFQNVPLHGTTVLDNSKLTLFIDNDTLNLTLWKDYILANTGEQTYIPSARDLVYVGYGIIAPEFDHNDYLGKDVIGKIVIIKDGEPSSNDKEYFNGDEPTIYSYPDVKHRIAISRGAAGTIIIPQFNSKDTVSWKNLVDEYSFEDVKLPYNASENFSIILNPKIAELFFDQGQVKPNLKANSSTISSYKLKFEGDFFQRDFKSSNVVGLIKSGKSAETDEFIIVSAHYDHLGIGPAINNDRIYNGVLDNAMGVAALIEISRQLYKIRTKLNRSIIFIATTGEEKGLLGSTYYVDHPIVPLYKTVANINIDGIAYLDDFKSIISIGANLSDLEKLVRQTSEEYKINISKIPKEFYESEAFNRSDQIAFAKAGIPSVLILDAPDYVNISYENAINKIIEYNSKVYHTPFDDLSIKINYFAVLKHSELISSLIFNVATSNSKINWKKSSPYNYIRLQTIAEKR